MKKVYAAVIIIFITSIFLFVFSLFYLDSEKHKAYNFTLILEEYEIGSIKVDKYITEDKLIYKSVSSLPFEPNFTQRRERLTLDRNYKLISYLKENLDGTKETTYLENNKYNISFVSTSNSEFAALTDMPVKQNTFVFRQDSPVTYLPILENYNFRLGRSQAFNVILNQYPLLPPMKRLLILTSVKDDYIRLGSRKIKVECLAIKMKGQPQGMLWVTKSGKSLVGIEYPDKKLKLIRTFLPKTVTAKPFSLMNNDYGEEEVKFENNKVSLAGTLTIPKKEGVCPAVLLIGSGRTVDRQNNGLFTYIADRLGKSGYLVLRYDKKGLGPKAGVSSKAVTDTGEFNDANAALDFLLSRKEADPKRIAVIGHDKGAFFAVKLASERKDIGTLILMAPLITLGGETDINFDNLREMATKLNWDNQYLKLVMKSRMETMDIVKSKKNDWISILRIRCYLKKLRDELNENPNDIIRKIEAPVLILHGKEDEFISAKSAAILDSALDESGNKNHKLIYYGYLGHFFGKKTIDGVHSAHYEVDKDVLDSIDKWLENCLPYPTAA